MHPLHNVVSPKTYTTTKHDNQHELLSHATVIDMRLYWLLTRTIKVYKYNFKVVILGVMSNIPDILLIFPLVSDVFNRTGIFKQATHHWVF
ncbi:hypothetical protein PHYBLDRAFT_150168 [Phycomyces blakesleeanus NRRL 1555(-)]|uniref:Uncharacterized protein n=1 Tax=Phycomyces blakesleeanus (strain ATCC 8743b / DSM 1359 / FGSC 10004 / NBRC 33097 / NRRL 1555) TaxID=763407 RepID=A0A162NDQ2_PHYB8|nr:hypothetical protein PHYBLDRAFT_150168 [Phycomyces blakesleeanus NRRL 1555(-)]OAD68574.1 hypothetical protein PHYBLDRAFT_150168 [Phycomyces blakesleeanus NRRL 1555(-)]|eukprot:XP_018286614.1 hypothetical protein PHYBLDRAFT_150168 [Phycomyces blakesleeanus NRRL 1555(-)]